MKKNKCNLAYLPTPLEKCQRLSELYGRDIYIKRDDMTGIELSGNKARKLEYLMQQAIDEGYDVVLTYGGTQSNHARATAVAATKLGLHCILLLDNTYETLNEGNLFLDRLLGVEIHFVEQDEPTIEQLTQTIVAAYAAQQKKVYIIPVGGSNAVGSLGYVDAAQELLQQLPDIDTSTSIIVTTVGSGGTYAGLLYGLKENHFKGTVLGVNISRDAASYEVIVKNLLNELDIIFDQTTFYENAIEILDGYVGDGYAKTSKEVMAFIQFFAQHTGIYLDPVYTGKAFFGFFDALAKGHYASMQNIVLMHTGGLFGYRTDQRDLIFEVERNH